MDNRNQSLLSDLFSSSFFIVFNNNMCMLTPVPTRTKKMVRYIDFKSSMDMEIVIHKVRIVIIFSLVVTALYFR